MARLDQHEYRTVRGMRAPTLDVLFTCPDKGCENRDVLDAYRGPPTCMGGRGGAMHLPVFMVAEHLVPKEKNA